jgi:nucleotide-binding universal stress UspA family protein
VPGGAIARRIGAALTLAVVHPLGGTEDAPFSGTQADLDLRVSEADYLARLRDRVTATLELDAKVTVLSGEVAASLAEFIREHRVDLVVASTHGRGTISRLLRGGHALSIVHAVSCPALLLKPLRPPAGLLSPKGVHRILVPLDGSAGAEASLGPALALATPASAEVLLMQVIPPVEDVQTLLELRQEAKRYLEDAASRLARRDGLRVDHYVTIRSNTGAAIVGAAGRWNADLIAITTRDRGETARVLFGSVADHVVEHAHSPVLVCHAAREPAAPHRGAAQAATAHS